MEHNISTLDFPDQLDPTRMRDTLRMHRDALKPHRDNYRKFKEQFVGTQYGDQGAEDPVPVNYIEMLASILSRTLVANNPRVEITTMQGQLKPVAKLLSLAADKRIRQLNMKQAIQDIVLDSIFLMGIGKVGTELGSEVRINGMPYQVTNPWLDIVDLHDYVVDTSTGKWPDIGFEANRFTVPLHILASDPTMNQSIVESLAPKDNLGYQEDGEESPETMGLGAEGSPREPFMKMVDCWDVWLPYHNQVVTIPDSGEGFLRQVKWTGPPDGPFHRLMYQKVPGNLMPLSPLATIFDLHEMINLLYRKMADQAERQKTIGLFRDEKLGQQVRDASDGDIIPTPDPSASREVKYGGMDPATLQYAMHAENRLSKVAGNLDLMGGFAAQSETATQDVMLAQAASQKLDHMQDKVEEFVGGVIRSFMYYDMQNPLLSVPVEVGFRNSDLRIPMQVSPARHFENFFQFNFDVQAYSMQAKSPNAQAAELMQITQGLLLPAAQLMAPQGVGINWSALIKAIGKLKQIPALADIVIDLSPMKDVGSEMARSERPPAPAVTHRINTRVNRSGTTQAGNEAKTMQAISGLAQKQGAA